MKYTLLAGVFVLVMFLAGCGGNGDIDQFRPGGSSGAAQATPTTAPPEPTIAPTVAPVVVAVDAAADMSRPANFEPGSIDMALLAYWYLAITQALFIGKAPTSQGRTRMLAMAAIPCNMVSIAVLALMAQLQGIVVLFLVAVVLFGIVALAKTFGASRSVGVTA